MRSAFGRPWHARHVVLLCLILAVGLALRLYGLGSQSMWEDEAFSIRMARLNPIEIVAKTAKADYNPPLYYLVLHAGFRLTGVSDVAARLPSVLFGLVSLVLIYKIGRLLFDEQTGILACVILALSSYHVLYSQEARAYALMACLSLASLYFFLRLLRERSMATSVGYVAFTALLMYAHYYAIFVLAAQHLYVAVLLLSPGEARELTLARWVRLQAALLVLYIPWVAPMIGQAASQHAEFWIPRPITGTLVYTLKAFTGLNRFLLMVFVVLALVFVTPVVAPFAISQVLKPIYVPRYTIAASLSLYLLTARGLTRLNRRGTLVLTALIVAVSSVSMWTYYQTPSEQTYRMGFFALPKPDMRSAVRDMDRLARPGDLVLLRARWYEGALGVLDYYSLRSDLTVRECPPVPVPPTMEDVRRAFETAAQGRGGGRGVLRSGLSQEIPCPGGVPVRKERPIAARQRRAGREKACARRLDVRPGAQ